MDSRPSLYRLWLTNYEFVGGIAFLPLSGGRVQEESNSREDGFESAIESAPEIKEYYNPLAGKE